jgi:hypothetical protein
VGSAAPSRAFVPPVPPSADRFAGTAPPASAEAVSVAVAVAAAVVVAVSVGAAVAVVVAVGSARGAELCGMAGGAVTRGAVTTEPGTPTIPPALSFVLGGAEAVEAAEVERVGAGGMTVIAGGAVTSGRTGAAASTSEGVLATPVVAAAVPAGIPAPVVSTRDGSATSYRAFCFCRRSWQDTTITVVSATEVTTATMIFHIVALRRRASAASHRGFIGSMRKTVHATCPAGCGRQTLLVAIDEAHQVPICPG